MSIIILKDRKRKIHKHLSSIEIRCKCLHQTCTQTIVRKKMIKMWGIVRKKVGKEIYLTSGCRCQRHNFEVGGAKGSQHCSGGAWDFEWPDHIQRWLFAQMWRDAGAGLVLHYDEHCHVQIEASVHDDFKITC